MRRAFACLVAVAALLGAAGCGEKEDVLRPDKTQQFELMLDYFPNADHAPIYAAQGAGAFEDAGLELKIRQPADPSAPIKQVAAGRVDLAVSYEPEVMRARSEGLRVISVGALVHGPLTSIISLPKAKIRTAADLEGKTVGTAGIDYQHAYLQTILNEANVPQDSVKERNLGFNLVPGLLTGKVDAVLGAFWNYEGIDLEQRGRKPRILRIEDAGVPKYDELVFVANEDALEQSGPQIRGFMQAVARGAAALERDPAKGTQALLDANRDLDPKLQNAVVRATLPYFAPPRGRPYGWQEAREWRRFGQWMMDARLIERGAEGAFTNRFLPGQGLGG